MLHDAAHAGMANSVNEVQRPAWAPPVLKTITTQNTGIQEVLTAIANHRNYLDESGLWQQRDRERLRVEVENLLRQTLVERWRSNVPSNGYEELLEKVFAREISPGRAIEALVNDWNHL
jgi:LAO/AO transport system kinase